MIYIVVEFGLKSPKDLFLGIRENIHQSDEWYEWSCYQVSFIASFRHVCFFLLLMGFDAVLGILCVCDALFQVEFPTGPPIFGTGTSN